jgi:hypothetical protein
MVGPASARGLRSSQLTLALEPRQVMLKYPIEISQAPPKNIQLKYHFGRFPSFCKNEFCKKIDDHVMYF